MNRQYLCFLSDYPLLSCLPASERLMGAVSSRVSIPGRGSVSRQPGLRPALHVQSRAPGEPHSVPLAQPRLLHGPQQPVLHPALTGRRPLPLLNHRQLLPGPLHLLPLPSLHEQPRQWPGVQDGAGGGIRRPRQPSPRRRGALLLAQRGRSELLVTLRDQEGLLTGGRTWGRSQTIKQWPQQARDSTEKTQSNSCVLLGQFYKERIQVWVCW